METKVKNVSRETQTQVEAIKWTDVRGKEMFYLKIKKNEKEVLINIGEKTYNNVKELENEPEQTNKMGQGNP